MDNCLGYHFGFGFFSLEDSDHDPDKNDAAAKPYPGADLLAEGKIRDERAGDRLDE